MTNRTPQVAIWDTGSDQGRAAAAFAQQVNEMIAALRKRVEAIEARLTEIDARIGAAAPEITGSRALNPALESLLAGLDGIGLVVDSTTAI